MPAGGGAARGGLTPAAVPDPAPRDAAPRDIDARDLLCPLPVLRLRKVLAATPPGGIVRLIATDPAAVIDVPHFCGQSGHVLISTDPAPDGARIFTVRRG